MTYQATIFTNDNVITKTFPARHPAKSYAGWMFEGNNEVTRVEVIEVETGRKMLVLDAATGERVSISE